MSLSQARAILLNPAGTAPGLITVAIITVTCSRYATRADLIAARELAK